MKALAEVQKLLVERKADILAANKADLEV